MTEFYDLHAIRYCTNPRRRRQENFMTLPPGDPHDGPMPIDFFVWVAKSDKRTILIDSGADESMCRTRGHDFLRCPTEGLKLLGIDAEDVGDVITTHLHWDHAGNFDKFPNARFHVQQREISHATGPCMENAFLRRPYDVEHAISLMRALYGGRVAIHDGEEELAPGFSIRRVGGHTPGMQVARVMTRRGWVVVASDAMHFYANREAGIPFAILVDVGEYMAAWQVLNRLADSPDHIIPGHDPRVLSIYPAATPGLEGTAVKLDVMPK
ncbi:MAG TPA: N-acyl homoserine lactonase family protein [Stellaceae bacterium]|nr:N-acyl homoserine lactonase family protein [Stellaceae bacterium]